MAVDGDFDLVLRAERVKKALESAEFADFLYVTLKNLL